jgi:hypothetical protein
MSLSAEDHRRAVFGAANAKALKDVVELEKKLHDMINGPLGTVRVMLHNASVHASGRAKVDPPSGGPPREERVSDVVDMLDMESEFGSVVKMMQDILSKAQQIEGHMQQKKRAAGVAGLSHDLPEAKRERSGTQVPATAAGAPAAAAAAAPAAAGEGAAGLADDEIIAAITEDGL